MRGLRLQRSPACAEMGSPAANPRSPRRSAPDVEYINRVQDQNAVWRLPERKRTRHLATGIALERILVPSFSREGMIVCRLAPSDFVVFRDCSFQIIVFLIGGEAGSPHDFSRHNFPDARGVVGTNVYRRASRAGDLAEPRRRFRRPRCEAAHWIWTGCGSIVWFLDVYTQFSTARGDQCQQRKTSRRTGNHPAG